MQWFGELKKHVLEIVSHGLSKLGEKSQVILLVASFSNIKNHKVFAFLKFSNRFF